MKDNKVGEENKNGTTESRMEERDKKRSVEVIRTRICEECPRKASNKRKRKRN